jgi:hypothetical protein
MLFPIIINDIVDIVNRTINIDNILACILLFLFTVPPQINNITSMNPPIHHYSLVLNSCRFSYFTFKPYHLLSDILLILI